MRKIYLIILLFTGVSAVEICLGDRWKEQVTNFDVSGYYVYLPAAFIYKDVTRLDFYAHVDSIYSPTRDMKWYGIFAQPLTRNRLNKYPVGVAIGELPAFLVAHAYCLLSGVYLADGYTLPYQLSIRISMVLWAMVGLYFLGKLLCKMFGENIAAVTLVLIAFGTNYYCYTLISPGMSHILLFMLLSIVLYATYRFYSTLRPGYLYMIGLFCGWAVIARPVDILIVLFPLLWSHDTRGGYWQEKRKLLKRFRKPVAGALLCFMLVVFLQLLYWKVTTGHFVCFSYKGEGFDFLDPSITLGLFSYGKGWFVYTPVAFFAVLGCIPLYFYNRQAALITALYLSLTIYVVFSWICWFYGWGFGARAMIDSLPAAALPLAALCRFIARQRIVFRLAGMAAGGFFIWLNIYQTHQYDIGTLPGNRMNRAYYWRIWNRMHVTEEDRKLLR